MGRSACCCKISNWFKCIKYMQRFQLTWPVSNCAFKMSLEPVQQHAELLLIRPVNTILPLSDERRYGAIEVSDFLSCRRLLDKLPRVVVRLWLARHSAISWSRAPGSWVPNVAQGSKKTILQTFLDSIVTSRLRQAFL